MKKEIYDEKNGLWYELHGDYYLPCLTHDEREEQRLVGIWGQRHLRFIKDHRRTLYAELLTSGKLNGYLADINEQAEEMFFRLVKELAEKEKITEQVKVENQMLWVQRMNNVRNRSEEIVNCELIFV